MVYGCNMDGYKFRNVGDSLQVAKRGKEMKIKRVIKLQRVRYSDLDEGDEFCPPRLYNGKLNEALICDGTWHDIGRWIALDFDKYPPESVAYTIEGIPALEWAASRTPNGHMVSINVDESEIETVYI